MKEERERHTRERWSLTENEVAEIIALRATGHTYNEIAERKGIASETASKHVNRLKDKTKDADPVEVVLDALEKGYTIEHSIEVSRVTGGED